MAVVNVTFPGNLAQVDSVAALRALPSTYIADDAAYLVDDAGLFQFDPGSSLVDDGTTILKPSDRGPLEAGRWLLTGKDSFAPAGLATSLASPAGALSIGFQQAGADAVASNLQREARYFVRPEQFGGAADSTGVGTTGTDNTAPIARAIASLGSRGGTVILSRGIYRHTGIDLPTNVHLVGEGSDSSVLYCPSVGANVSAGDGAAEIRNAGLSHLKLLGTTTSGFSFRGRRFGNQCTLDDVYTDYGKGIDCELCYTSIIQNSRVFQSQGKGIRIGTTCHNMTVRKTMINACLEDGIEVNGSYNVTIEENDLEFNQRNAILLTDGRGITIRKNYFEGLAPRASGYAGVRVVAADTVAVEDNKFDATQTNYLGTDGTGTYLKVDGGSRIKHRNNAFVSISNSQTHVAFGAGASNCEALVPLGAVYTNASSSSRVFNDFGDEMGVLALQQTAHLLTDATWTKIQFSTKTYDPKGEWSTSTHQFTPKDYGVYAVNIIVGVALLSTNAYFFTRLWDATAGAEVAKKQTFPNNFVNSNPIEQTLFQEFLLPGHAYEVQVFLDDSTNRNTAASASTQRLSVKRIG